MCDSISDCCFPIKSSFSAPFSINLGCLRGRGGMGRLVTSETLSLPVSLPVLRGPMLAEPHDGQAIKEPNESTTQRSLLFSSHFLFGLWLIFKRICLPPAAAFQLKWSPQWSLSAPSPLSSIWLWKWPGIIHQLSSSTLHLLGEEEWEKNGSHPGFFISSCSFPAVILHFKRSWPLWVRGHVRAALLIP